MKIVVNGREYASIDEMSAEARETYERAMASLTGDSRASTESAGQLRVRTETRIVVNGREYAGVDQTPADVRRLYQIATATAAGKGGSAGPARWLVLGALLGAGLVLAVLAWLGVL